MENTRIVAMKDKDLETLKDQEVIDISSWGLLMVNGPCFLLVVEGKGTPHDKYK